MKQPKPMKWTDEDTKVAMYSFMGYGGINVIPKHSFKWWKIKVMKFLGLKHKGLIRL